MKKKYCLQLLSIWLKSFLLAEIRFIIILMNQETWRINSSRSDFLLILRNHFFSKGLISKHRHSASPNKERRFNCRFLIFHFISGRSAQSISIGNNCNSPLNSSQQVKIGRASWREREEATVHMSVQAVVWSQKYSCVVDASLH